MNHAVTTLREERRRLIEQLIDVREAIAAAKIENREMERLQTALKRNVVDVTRALRIITPLSECGDEAEGDQEALPGMRA